MKRYEALLALNTRGKEDTAKETIERLEKVIAAEGAVIEQIQRLFATQMYNGASPKFDDGGRVRLDDLEMDPGIQAEIVKIWPQVTTENLGQLTDLEGYRTEFLKLFGFGLPGIDYDAEVEPHLAMP